MGLAGGEGSADESSKGDNSSRERELHGRVEGEEERCRTRLMLLRAVECSVFNLLSPLFCMKRRQLSSR